MVKMLRRQLLLRIFEVYKWVLAHLPLIVCVFGGNIDMYASRNFLSGLLRSNLYASIKGLFSKRHFTSSLIIIQLGEKSGPDYFKKFITADA